MDIRILIAAHKPYGFAQDDIYMPVQVGAALNDKFGAACDDTGDNISDLCITGDILLCADAGGCLAGTNTTP